jgi:hypothetical protein
MKAAGPEFSERITLGDVLVDRVPAAAPASA